VVGAPTSAAKQRAGREKPETITARAGLTNAEEIHFRYILNNKEALWLFARGREFG